MTAIATPLIGPSSPEIPPWNEGDAYSYEPKSSETAFDTKEAAQLFKLLSDETRLRILRLLKQQTELNVQTLCGLLQQTQPAVSHHLGLLRGAELVQLRRCGKHNFYRLRPKRFADIADALGTFLPDTVSME
jgi:ArsR family transcriptional regulator, arsenate/arsenite/antimonite-responsive transcriptional repressor